MEDHCYANSDHGPSAGLGYGTENKDILGGEEGLQSCPGQVSWEGVSSQCPVTVGLGIGCVFRVTDLECRTQMLSCDWLELRGPW